MRCTIRAGTFLVFGVAGLVAIDEDSPDDVRAIVEEHFPEIKRAALWVNGRRLRKPGRLVTTRVYRTQLLPVNIFNYPAGRYFSQSRGYFAILSAPPVGKHTIKTLGVFEPPDQPRAEPRMTYRLTVRDADSG